MKSKRSLTRLGAVVVVCVLTTASYAVRTREGILPPPVTSGPIEFSIMPIGDSVSAGLVGHPEKPDRISYRPFLWEMLQSRSDVQSADLVVDFVGIVSRTGTGGTLGAGPNPVLDRNNDLYMPTFDDHNSARRGFSIGRFDVEGLAQRSPDAALILLGTNDVITAELFEDGDYDQEDVARSRAALSDMIRALQSANPDVSVLLGTVPPQYWYIDDDQTEEEVGGYAGPDDPHRDDDGDGAWEVRYEGNEISMLNDMIRTLGSDGVADLSTRRSQVVIVDHAANYIGDPNSEGTHSIDGVHPNIAGDRFLAENWFVPLSSVLSQRVSASGVISVPEPSPFLLLAVVGAFLAFFRRAHRASLATKLLG